MAGINIFFSYAQEDQALVEELKKHLITFKRNNLISEWYDHSFLPGSSWTQEHEQHLEQATLITLLVTPDFVGSDYCFGTEVRRAMERYTAGTAYVLPILLKPVLWEGTPFANLKPLPANTKFVTTWPDRNEAFLDIAQGFQRILKHFQSTAESLAQTPSYLSSSSQPIFMLPFRRDPFFTGREAILARLRALFLADETIALTQPPALSGLGGIGKTQTAIEYAYRYREHYQHIFWVRAATPSEIFSDLLKIAELLNLPEQQANDQDLIIAAVKHWLGQNSGWLLIFDNADELEMVAPYLPLNYTGHLLFTTRSQHPGSLAQPIDLEQMSLEEGALLLLRRSRLLDPVASLAQAKLEDLEFAQQLVVELGGLPLALNQAGSYIEETKCTLVKYLSLYRTQRKKMLALRGRQADIFGHPASVATSWQLCFANVEIKNPAAAELLRLCAFLAPDAIPEELFPMGAKLLGPILGPVVADPFAFEEALSDLLAHSLLRRDPETQVLLMHRLVQAVLKDDMTKQTQRFWIECATKVVNTALPKMTFDNWDEYERLLPQVQNCLQFLEVNELLVKEAGRLLNECALYLKDRYGFFQMAEQMYQRAYKLYENLLGAKHPSALITQNNLALAYSAQGRYEEAEQLYQQICKISEQILGAEHRLTLTTQNNLAVVYSDQERYVEAERLYQQVYKISEKVLGVEHPSTLTALGNLAGVYRGQKRYEEAERLYQQVCEVRARTLGADHPDVLIGQNNLALVYSAQERYEEAERLYQQVREVSEEVLGPEHPSTLMTLGNLAGVYNAQGFYTEAEALYALVCEVQERVLGMRHPYLAISLSNLAEIYSVQHKYEEAEDCYLRVVAIKEVLYGSKHPELITDLSALVKLYQDQIKEELLNGLKYSEIITNLSSLVKIYQMRRKHEETETFLHRIANV